ncbi:MAG: hypothetical protein ACREJ2_18250, partial [Planctomycetota bacterium]
MSDTTADLLLQELLHVFRTTICTAPGETVRADLFQREAGRRLLPKWGGFGAAAAAWLALEDHRGNPWHGRDDLLQFAFAAADRLLVDHAALGGPGRAGRKPNHFTIYPLAQLYTLAAEQAGAARRARWRELMARNLRRVAETIDRTWPTLGRPGPFAGTGPNHLFGWIAIGLAQAVVLEDDRLARRCEAAMLRHLKIQAPGGYFPEHDGPVVLYHCVSLEGVSEFFRHRPLPVVARALERGVDFYLRAIYPDLTGIETFDERNRGVHATTPVGAFAWTPAGRRLLRLIVERRHAARGA